jgi:hypothetical protein
MMDSEELIIRLTGDVMTGRGVAIIISKQNKFFIVKMCSFIFSHGLKPHFYYQRSAYEFNICLLDWERRSDAGDNSKL